jgi:hypothetical protein
MVKNGQIFKICCCEFVVGMPADKVFDADIGVNT